MTNSAADAKYLNGSNFGLAGFGVDCDSTEDDTAFVDIGSEFIPYSMTSSNAEASISIPKDVVCQQLGKYLGGFCFYDLGGVCQGS